MKIVTVVLAGGEGRRIGGGKPLRLLGERPLLDHAIEQARQWSDQVAIALRFKDQLGDIQASVIIDEQSVEGPLAGLIAALRFGRGAGAQAVLTIPADMPYLPEDLADRLRERLGTKVAAIASSAGRLHPICGLWRVAALDSLPKYLGSDRRSLRGFADLIGYVEVDWSIQSGDPFFNINSPQDLAKAHRRLGS